VSAAILSRTVVGTGWIAIYGKVGSCTGESWRPEAGRAGLQGKLCRSPTSLIVPIRVGVTLPRQWAPSTSCRP
jgi:hypothetical protein